MAGSAGAEHTFRLATAWGYKRAIRGGGVGSSLASFVPALHPTYTALAMGTPESGIKCRIRLVRDFLFPIHSSFAIGFFDRQASPQVRS